MYRDASSIIQRRDSFDTQVRISVRDHIGVRVIGVQVIDSWGLSINSAKKIQNKPKVNEVMDDHALLRRQMKELEDAKKRMLEDKEAMMHQLEEHEKYVRVP